MARKIQKPKINKGYNFQAIEAPEYDSKPPLFSLERVQNGSYCFSKLREEDQCSFANSIFKRRNIPWKTIRTLPKHGLGTEKIPRGQIRTAIPKFLTEDFDKFLVFRFNGLKPMIGYRFKDVFYILWFDHDFTVYKH